MSNRPQVICLTPVRNEAPILPRFLAAAARWADAIVVADQGSSDGSREIAATHPKVLLVDNPIPNYDEGQRQRLLVEAARAAFPGRRVLVALDADEALTSDASSSRGWDALLSAAPGTPVLMRWLNLLPGGLTWVPARPIRFALVDDGTDHRGDLIHSTRLPAGSRRPLELDDVAVVHLQYLDQPRVRAKQRWYQAWERVQFPEKRPTQIYRQYHHMDARPRSEIVPSEARWLDGYEAAGIDLTSVEPTALPWWDTAVLELVIERGPEFFRRIDIWDHDWSDAARALAVPTPQDPRSRVDRLVLRCLARTQRADHRLAVRAVQRALAVMGW